MEIHETAEQVIKRLKTLRNPATDQVRAVRREFSRLLTDAPAGVVLGVAHHLLRQPGPAYRFVAYELINKHPAALASLDKRELERLGSGIDSWGAVDTFACYLAGPAWRANQIPDDLIRQWAHSADRWWRRAALVSTVPLNNKTQGGKGDTQRTLRICAMLIRDRDDMVVKAMSWALRQLAKRDSDAVRKFLAQHEGSLAARVLREVENKLTTGRKNPRRVSEEAH